MLFNFFAWNQVAYSFLFAHICVRILVCGHIFAVWLNCSPVAEPAILTYCSMKMFHGWFFLPPFWYTLCLVYACHFSLFVAVTVSILCYVVWPTPSPGVRHFSNWAARQAVDEELAEIARLVSLLSDTYSTMPRPLNLWVASPVCLVKKPDGSYRFCIDYRRVNTGASKNVFPIHDIQDALDSLTGAKWFSTLDLDTGSWGWLTVRKNDLLSARDAACFNWNARHSDSAEPLRPFAG